MHTKIRSDRHLSIHVICDIISSNSFDEENTRWVATRSDSTDFVAHTKDLYLFGPKEWTVHNDSKVKSLKTQVSNDYSRYVMDHHPTQKCCLCQSAQKLNLPVAMVSVLICIQGVMELHIV